VPAAFTIFIHPYHAGGGGTEEEKGGILGWKFLGKMIGWG